MSMRSYRDQIRAEDAAFAEFDANLGTAESAFYSMTMQDTADAIGCDLHKVPAGKVCGITHRSAFVCIGRRIAAAKASVASA